MSSNLRNIGDKGGNKIAVFELDSNLQFPVELVSGVNCLDLGHIANSELALKTKKTVYKNEAGQVVASDFEHEGATTGTLMETDKLKLDFLTYTVRNKKYLEYKYLGIKGGNHQESFKIAEITPQMKISSPGGAKSMQYESTAVANGSDFVLDQQMIYAAELALGINIRTSGPVTIMQGT
jgi:hypothetical protein